MLKVELALKLIHTREILSNTKTVLPQRNLNYKKKFVKSYKTENILFFSL